MYSCLFYHKTQQTKTRIDKLLELMQLKHELLSYFSSDCPDFFSIDKKIVMSKSPDVNESSLDPGRKERLLICSAVDFELVHTTVFPYVSLKP
jgi:hypothetical protein